MEEEPSASEDVDGGRDHHPDQADYGVSRLDRGV